MFAYVVIAISCDLWTKGWQRATGRECGWIETSGDNPTEASYPISLRRHARKKMAGTGAPALNETVARK